MLFSRLADIPCQPHVNELAGGGYENNRAVMFRQYLHQLRLIDHVIENLQ